MSGLHAVERPVVDDGTADALGSRSEHTVALEPLDSSVKCAQGFPYSPAKGACWGVYQAPAVQVGWAGKDIIENLD